jgi:histidine decarboxylase
MTSTDLLAAMDPWLPLDVHAARFIAEQREDRPFHLGFPGATDITYPDLAGALTAQLLNNVGDPWDDGHGRNHTKKYERFVVVQLAALFGAGEDAWGYVTPGATEGTIYAIDEAADAFPDLVVYASQDAHYSVAKAARLVRATLVQIYTDQHGRMRLDHLREELKRRRDLPAAIVATVGTTEHEAVDDVAGIAGILQDLGISRYRLHVDAALAGIPRALLPAGQRPEFGFSAGATSLVISGHKFLSTLTSCAVLLYPRRPEPRPGSEVPYIGSLDTTISGSRSGHTPLLLYWSLISQGIGGHRRRADTARELAAYTHDRLRRLGWPATWRHPDFTITLAQPPVPLPRPWVLGGDHSTGRIICMPGLRREWIDDFLDDLTAIVRGRTSMPAARLPEPAGEATS